MDCIPPGSSVHGIFQAECGIGGHQINTHQAFPPQTNHLGSGCALHSLLTPCLRPSIPRASPSSPAAPSCLLCFPHPIFCSHWPLSSQSPPQVQPPDVFITSSAPDPKSAPDSPQPPSSHPPPGWALFVDLTPFLHQNPGAFWARASVPAHQWRDVWLGTRHLNFLCSLILKCRLSTRSEYSDTIFQEHLWEV